MSVRRKATNVPKSTGKSASDPKATARTVAVPKSKSGVPLTDELIEELAREAEAGYDLSHGRRVGRPSLTSAGGVSPRVNFRITAELHHRALERAEREGKTLSDLAREALEHYVQ
jgi:predicted HicB family RNase H-like nuclease